MIAFGCHVRGARTTRGGLALLVGGSEPVELCARIVINSAGLFAPAVAATIEGMPAQLVPPSYFARGNYFVLSGKSPVLDGLSIPSRYLAAWART